MPRLNKGGIIRISSGDLRGRVIRVPAGNIAHPMGTRERLGLFNVISPYLSQAEVLDAYAGTGALGFEALSRGASHVVFIEQSPIVAKVLCSNIQMLKLERQSTVVVSSVDSFVQKSLVNNANMVAKNFPFRQTITSEHLPSQYDLILADPPYSHYQPEMIVPLAQLLCAGGYLMLSHPRNSKLPDFPTLRLKNIHLYAGCQLSLFASS